MTTDLWMYGNASMTSQDLTGFTVEALDGAIGKIDEATNEVGGSYIGVDNLEGYSAGHGTRMAAAIGGHAPSAAGGPSPSSSTPARGSSARRCYCRQVSFATPTSTTKKSSSIARRSRSRTRRSSTRTDTGTRATGTKSVAITALAARDTATKTFAKKLVVSRAPAILPGFSLSRCASAE